jgi:hypothetical protein
MSAPVYGCSGLALFGMAKSRRDNFHNEISRQRSSLTKTPLYALKTLS